jgi:NAD(P)-dependent dehydrogenase (short-subunit alcohol dehydrogenase family)
MNTILITGANRGLGLEFTRQYLEDGQEVIATARNMDSVDDLEALRDEHGDRLAIHRLDVTDRESIESTYESVRDQYDSLDILINNAGTMGSKESFDSLTDVDLESVFEVNTVGPFMVTQEFLPFVQDSRGKVIFITSLMGSIEDNGIGGSYPYRISKVGLNMLGRTLSNDYPESEVQFLLLHPGWAKTRMGGEGAKIDPDTSVSGMRDVIADLDEEMNGEFFNYEGTRMPW